MTKPPASINSNLTLEACFQKWEELLKSVGVELGSETSRQMKHFLDQLKLWNRRVRLVSFSSDEELILSHLVDSLFVLQDSSVQSLTHPLCLDVGSGGGFPGVPLRLAKPNWSMTLLESVKKKATFLEVILERFPMQNCAVVRGRAEEMARRDEYREKFDLAFCRAVGGFSTDLELVLPFLKVGGLWLAHRGSEALQEVSEAGEALKILGAAVTGTVPYRLPHLDKIRYIVRVEKKSPTPSNYPRRPGVAAQRPL